jgi:hypothetical protein
MDIRQLMPPAEVSISCAGDLSCGNLMKSLAPLQLKFHNFWPPRVTSNRGLISETDLNLKLYGTGVRSRQHTTNSLAAKEEIARTMMRLDNRL